MNGHMSEWLSAYYDGELRGSRLQQVEQHLSSCPDCQAELEALGKLSVLLQEVPSPESWVSPQRFQAQVMRRLPPANTQPGWQRGLKAGWQLAPLGAVLAWAFGQAIWLVTSLVSFLSLPLGLSRAGLLSGGLSLASPSPGWGEAETLVELGLLNLVFSGLVAIFLCGWLASWWVMHRASQTRNDHPAGLIYRPG